MIPRFLSAVSAKSVPPILVIPLLLASSGQGANGPTDLTLNDGRELKSARIVDIRENDVMVAHSGGVIYVPVDVVPLDVIARANEGIAARREAHARLTSDLQAKEQELRARRGDSSSSVPGTAKPAKSRLLANGKFALVPTGEDGPKELQENGCVVASNSAGTGTGFILRQREGFVLVTNQHVINGGAPHKYELADSRVLKPLAGVIAKDRDLVVFELEGSFSNYFEMEADVTLVALGEDVLIFGNSEGKGMRSSKAKLVAKSQTQLEVSGGIVMGNSGGPILRAKTGKVIGVSTYVTVRSSSPRTIEGIVAASALPKVQYYGVRIDSLSNVADFDLRSFMGDFQALQAEEQRLERALSLLVLMHQKIGGRTSSQTAQLAKNADNDVRRTVGLLQHSTFSPGTFSVVDVNAFRGNAAGYFAPVYSPRSFIHAQKRDELIERRAVLLEIYADLLKRIPVR